MAANPESVEACLRQFELLMAKILTAPIPVLACLGGHAAAAGGLLAMSCDFRVMGSSGLFFIPAVKLGITLSPGMVSMLVAKLDSAIARDVVLYGRRLRSDELAVHGIVSLRPETRERTVLLKRCCEFLGKGWDSAGGQSSSRPQPLLGSTDARIRASTTTHKKLVYDLVYKKLTEPPRDRKDDHLEAWSQLEKAAKL